ncbi:50S ribosomal protein L1 [Oleiagrimonas sp.]|jgi:large subunit ribosomal protein L1|uniref:50S ribosomal protein L1 n=1 Tax=Oleiagrimonas sp. TaxID=2010330 RepID=UPI0026363A8C|nr:50S ribosomal protein L1 [Oleiagrimonas sp.]MDA3914341.1 50S ribosomal protein L1 [Oleiagrimonas sp.]
MAKLTKRFKTMQDAVEPGKAYPLTDALGIIKDNAKAKFVESIDISVRLGIDARKSDQGVRGSSLLPHGTGKTVRVAVFCPPGEKAEAAKAAGADAVGMDDLAERMQGGDLGFDRVIATPDAMRVVGKLGQLLGPRGLMPNPKDGSVSADVVTAVNNAKAGQVKFRNDKAGIIHASVGKADFDVEKLAENINMLISDLMKAKPSTAKGQYLQKVSVSSTMGMGVAVDTSSLTVAK